MSDVERVVMYQNQVCKICSERHEENNCHSATNCHKCGNNRQVWVNQITGVLTCHRSYCNTEIDT